MSYPNDSNLRFSSDARADYLLNGSGYNDNYGYNIFPMPTTAEVSAVVHQMNNNNNDVRDGNKTLFVLGEKTNNDVNMPTKMNISSQNPRSKKRKIIDDMHVHEYI